MMKSNKGIKAEKPRNIPWTGWKEVLKRVKNQSDENNIPILAAGVAFYFFMALFPALLAVVSLYALMTEPIVVKEHLNALQNFMPTDAHEFLSEKIENILETQSSTLGWGFFLSFVFSIWSANKGTFSLFRAINETYDEKNTRGMIKQNAITLGFTVGLMIVGFISLAIVVAFPALKDSLGFPDALDKILRYARWLFLAVIVMFCIALIYQFAPQRSRPSFRWVSPGAIIATVLWILGSLILTLYVQNFDNLEDLYGQISAIIILMIWLNITAFVVLLGAQINAETEHQTEKDTTHGKDKPIGERHAHFADRVAGKNSEKE